MKNRGSEATERIVGLLLAAGASRRMGRLKQLLPFGQETVLEASLRRYREAEIRPVVVVLGYEAERIRRTLGPALEGADLRVVINREHEQGMLRSVQVGIAEVARMHAHGVVLGLVDQPFVPAEVFRQVRDALREGKAGVVLPRWGGRRGHPIGLRAELFGEVLQLNSRAVGLNAWIRAHPERVWELPVATDAVLQDMDLPEEYQEALRRWIATAPKESE
ncbi:MAG: glycosyl transferase [Candidatus Poribacteria bacterium]|nr:MAG: glycosyl transferase [Candidatus Poribacteria bacterium]